MDNTQFTRLKLVFLVFVQSHYIIKTFSLLTFFPFPPYNLTKLCPKQIQSIMKRLPIRILSIRRRIRTVWRRWRGHTDSKPRRSKNAACWKSAAGAERIFWRWRANLPDSEFTGIDLSANHIKQGKKAVVETGAKNLHLICADLLQADLTDFGKFDYIIAHGFFSWIPNIVREKFLEIVREHLAPDRRGFCQL